MEFVTGIDDGSERISRIFRAIARSWVSFDRLPFLRGEPGNPVNLRSCVFGLICLLAFQGAYGGGHAARAERCIAENSGADSVACLERLHQQTQRKIRRLESTILARLERRREAGELTETHHQLAVSSLREAAKAYAGFSARQCDFAVGASGAVASGSAQVRWSCLIRLADSRIRDLDAILSGK